MKYKGLYITLFIFLLLLVVGYFWFAANYSRFLKVVEVDYTNKSATVKSPFPIGKKVITFSNLVSGDNQIARSNSFDLIARFNPTTNIGEVVLLDKREKSDIVNQSLRFEFNNNAWFYAIDRKPELKIIQVNGKRPPIKKQNY